MDHKERADFKRNGKLVPYAHIADAAGLPGQQCFLLKWVSQAICQNAPRFTMPGQQRYKIPRLAGKLKLCPCQEHFGKTIVKAQRRALHVWSGEER